MRKGIEKIVSGEVLTFDGKKYTLIEPAITNIFCDDGCAEEYDKEMALLIRG